MAERMQESQNRQSQEVARSQPRASTGLTRRASMSPFGLLQEMSNEMSRLFDNLPLASDTGRNLMPEVWAPQVDVLRKGENLVVRADLPGMSKDDISIDVTDNVMTIRGERREEKEEEREGYYWHERSEGYFSRSIPLPRGTNVDQAKARFDNGVLEVTMPAPRDEEQRGKKIDIR